MLAEDQCPTINVCGRLASLWLGQTRPQCTIVQPIASRDSRHLWEGATQQGVHAFSWQYTYGSIFIDIKGTIQAVVTYHEIVISGSCSLYSKQLSQMFAGDSSHDLSPLQPFVIGALGSISYS